MAKCYYYLRLHHHHHTIPRLDRSTLKFITVIYLTVRYSDNLDNSGLDNIFLMRVETITILRAEQLLIFRGSQSYRRVVGLLEDS